MGWLTLSIPYNLSLWTWETSPTKTRYRKFFAIRLPLPSLGPWPPLDKTCQKIASGANNPVSAYQRRLWCTYSSCCSFCLSPRGQTKPWASDASPNGPPSCLPGKGDAPADAPKAHVGAVLPEPDLRRLRQSPLPVAGKSISGSQRLSCRYHRRRRRAHSTLSGELLVSV